MKWLKKLISKNTSEPASKSDSSEGRALKVSDYLTKKQVLFFHAGPSKQQILGSLIAALDLSEPNAALKAILAREEVGSTVVSPGLALPHARIAGIRRLRAAVGICPPGILDAKSAAEPIRVFVLFLGPADNMKEHLGFLAAVSALFQRPGFMSELQTQTTPQGAMDVIAQYEKQLS